MYLLEKITNLLPPKLRPCAKAVWPPVVALAGAGASWAATGNLNTAEVRTAAGGIILGLVSFAVPNRDA